MEHSQHLIKLWGLDFNPQIIVMTWMVMAVIILGAWLAARNLRWVPQGWQAVFEMLVEFIEDSIKDTMGHKGIKYTYFFGSIFLFILIANMWGLIPGLVSPTKDVSVTLGLALLVLIWMQYIGIRENGLVNYLKHFITPFPAFLPIHLMELVTRPLTLALRLFGNIFAGEILLEVLTKNFPYVAPSAWLIMSVVIGGIQAYIFTVLSLAYTGLSMGDHQE